MYDACCTSNQNAGKKPPSATCWPRNSAACQKTQMIPTVALMRLPPFISECFSDHSVANVAQETPVTDNRRRRVTTARHPYLPCNIRRFAPGNEWSLTGLSNTVPAGPAPPGPVAGTWLRQFRMAGRSDCRRHKKNGQEYSTRDSMILDSLEIGRQERPTLNNGRWHRRYFAGATSLKA